MPQENIEPTNRFQKILHNDSTKIFLIILLLVITCILASLVLLLLTKDGKESSTQVSQSKSLDTSSTRTMVTSNQSSSLTDSSNKSNSSGSISSSTNSSSLVKFVHNEGKYVRFDYPENWRVDVGSKRADGTFNSFNDIGGINISIVGRYSIGFDTSGGYGCLGGAEWYIEQSDLTKAYSKVLLDNPDPNDSNPYFEYRENQIANFQKVKVSVPKKSAYDLYLIEFDYKTFPQGWSGDSPTVQQLSYFDKEENRFINIACNYWMELDKSSAGINTEIQNLTFAAPMNGGTKVNINTLGEIIEKFINSIEKK
ncbi:hypothetical protein IPJ91_00195 [bacterium]|nr:MAG: hypothetical protein IPJ91_00195 [bacterium]